MRYRIFPKKSVGPIEFGMSVVDVRSRLDSNPESFRRTPDSAHPLDYFGDLGLFVNYSSDGKVEAIELDETAKLEIDETYLNEMTFRAVSVFFESLNTRFKSSSDSVSSSELCISFWFPDGVQDDNSLAKSVLIYSEGYLDQA